MTSAKTAKAKATMMEEKVIDVEWELDKAKTHATKVEEEFRE